MTPDTSLSYEILFKKLEENHDELPPAYIFELLVGLLFGALQAIEKKYQYPISGEIMDGVRTEFIKHAKPVTELSDDEFNSFIAKRFQEYNNCLNNHSGAGYLWHLGKQYYWNIISNQKENITSPMTAGLYIFKATEMTNQIIKEYKVLKSS